MHIIFLAFIHHLWWHFCIASKAPSTLNCHYNKFLEAPKQAQSFLSTHQNKTIITMVTVLSPKEYQELPLIANPTINSCTTCIPHLNQILMVSTHCAVVAQTDTFDLSSQSKLMPSLHQELPLTVQLHLHVATLAQIGWLMQENEEGKHELNECNNFKKHCSHKLRKPSRCSTWLEFATTLVVSQMSH
jgi:hypothetical protein